MIALERTMSMRRFLLVFAMIVVFSSTVWGKPPLKRTLLSTQSALDTAVVMGESTMEQCQETAVYIRWGAAVTAGSVIVETASDSTYTGTWASLTTVAWSAAGKEDVVQITGVMLALRTRISVASVGGAVDTWLLCN